MLTNFPEIFLQFSPDSDRAAICHSGLKTHQIIEILSDSYGNSPKYYYYYYFSD